MRYFTILSLSAFIGTPLVAQDVPMGCYFKDYSQGLLQRNSEQVVDRMSILFVPYDLFPSYDLSVPAEGRTLANAYVKVRLADQGHAARDGYGGMHLFETAGNFNAPLEFGVECDGGSFDVATFDADAIAIETSIRLGQAPFITQLRSALMRALASSMSFRMSAVMATFGGFPALINA